MTDDRDRFDRELGERLRSHEQRAPGGTAPRVTDGSGGRGWAPLALIGAAGVVAGAVLIALLLQPGPPTGQGTPSPSASSSQDVLVSVPTQAPWTGETPQPCMAALLVGTLTRDATSGLVVVAGGNREIVLWPNGFVARESGGRLELLDANGQVVATEGDSVQIGGGDVGGGQWEACPYDIVASVATPAPSVGPTATPASPFVATPVAGLGPGDAYLMSIGRFEETYVLLGQDQIWTSPDGSSWTPADMPQLPAEAPALIQFREATSGPNGMVAVGGYFVIDFGTPRIWHSTDGSRWASVYGPDDPAQGDCGSIAAVAADASGYVAVGGICPNNPASEARIWASADGETWQLREDPAFTGFGLNDIANGKGRYVIVGGDGLVGVTFVSTDGGRTWSTKADQAALAGVASMHSVAVANGSFVAAGTRADGAPMLWSSTDGLAWTITYTGDPSESFSAVIAAANGFIAVGGEFPSASWSGEGAPPGDTVEAWVSADGLEWSGPSTVFAPGRRLSIGGAVAVNGELLIAADVGEAQEPYDFAPVVLQGPIPQP